MDEELPVGAALFYLAVFPVVFALKLREQYLVGALIESLAGVVAGDKLLRSPSVKRPDAAVSRCDAELVFYSGLHDRPAYLVTMALHDWQTEKRLIAGGSLKVGREPSKALASGTADREPL